MARSGSVDYSVTASAIITRAARMAGLVGQGQTVHASMLSAFQALLNMMIKQWQGMNDFAPGLKVWTRRRGTLFLQQNQHRYLLGPTGDHATDSYVETTMVSLGPGNSGMWAPGVWGSNVWGQNVWLSSNDPNAMLLDSSDGISVGDHIGIWLDDGSVHWTIVTTVAGGDIVYVDDPPDSPSAGARVVAYTTKSRRPLEILTAFIRDEDENDCPVRFMDLPTYDGIRHKSYEKTPESIFFEAQLGNALLFTDSNPDDVSKVLKFTYLSDVEDIDAPGNDFDYPAAWFLPLATNLAVLGCIEYQRAVPIDLRNEASTSLAIAKHQYPETCSDYFQPGLD